MASLWKYLTYSCNSTFLSDANYTHIFSIKFMMIIINLCMYMQAYMTVENLTAGIKQMHVLYKTVWLLNSVELSHYHSIIILSLQHCSIMRSKGVNFVVPVLASRIFLQHPKANTPNLNVILMLEYFITSSWKVFHIMDGE